MVECLFGAGKLKRRKLNGNGKKRRGLELSFLLAEMGDEQLQSLGLKRIEGNMAPNRRHRQNLRGPTKEGNEAYRALSPKRTRSKTYLVPSVGILEKKYLGG